MLDDTNFTADARAELARQIEELAPSAVKLAERGFSWQLGMYLEQVIKSGAPDLGELRSQGLDIKTAVSICEAISARHARKAAAIAAIKAPAPAPKPRPPAPAADELDGMAAMSRLHTLFSEAQSGAQACITNLMNDGWSEATSRELVRVINASLPIQRAVK